MARIDRATMAPSATPIPTTGVSYGIRPWPHSTGMVDSKTGKRIFCHIPLEELYEKQERAFAFNPSLRGQE